MTLKTEKDRIQAFINLVDDRWSTETIAKSLQPLLAEGRKIGLDELTTRKVILFSLKLRHMEFKATEGRHGKVNVPAVAISELTAIIMPPGYRLATVLRFLLTSRAFKRYVEPVIADMQHEYIEAIAFDHKWHARWIAIRGHLLVVPGWLYAFIMGKLGELLRRGR